MSENQWDKLKQLPCKHLRSHEMFYDSDTAKDEEYASGLFWCCHTDNCLGPDGAAADDESCDCKRGCFEN